ncbi:MAG: hypothetical protein ACREGJ_02345 [Candidatus Saccharimonadales bacterium]
MSSSAIICPTVLAENPHAYREQMARIAPFAKRVQIDLADGEFAPVRTVNPVQVYWPEEILADLHLMLKKPAEHTETIISLQPHLVIVHAEAEGDLLGMMRQLRAVNIKCGVALLKESNPNDFRDIIGEVDHVLIFSGDLGHFGGQADMEMLRKIGPIRSINANVEIGWDGGVSGENAAQLALGGVEVLNVGGYIQRAEDPAEAYKRLTELLDKLNIEV